MGGWDAWDGPPVAERQTLRAAGEPGVAVMHAV